jgi:glycerol-3-phosphate O-acyltransferase
VENKNSLNQSIGALSARSQNFFLCYLPKRIGFLAAFILRQVFNGITVSPDQIAVIKELPENAIVIYATKYKSYFDYLFYYTRFQQDDIIAPEIGFNYKVLLWQPVSRLFRILWSYLDYFLKNLSFPDPYLSGYIKNELIGGRAALLSLIDKKSFYRIFVKEQIDPVRYLIEMQKSIDRPIFIVPQLIFFTRKPDKSVPTLVDILFGRGERPGGVRRLIAMLKNPGKVFMEVSQPVDLQQFIRDLDRRQPDIEQQAHFVRRHLLHRMNRHRQTITGPVLKSSQELKESILTGERLRSVMGNYSQTKNIPIYQVHKKADAYIDEIAARYSTGITKVMETFVGFIIKIMFEGVTINKDVLKKIKTMSQEGPLIFAPCHKSHIDYLVLSYMLFHHNMPVPHVAAGKNLSFWPLGPLFRGAGAFFLRRSFKGAALYSKVFAEYIHKLLEEGYNIEFFIEGGRSRTGKLIPPKIGLLSIILDAFKNGACNDMIIVPTFIGYDRILEENAYLHEIEGGQKNPETLLQVIKARKFLKKKYGKIYINFHEPFSIKDFLAKYHPQYEKMDKQAYYELCRHLGYRILNAIDRVTNVTPHALVASVLLNCSKKRFTYKYLMSRLETYMDYLISQQVELSDTLLLDQDYAVGQVINSYLQRKLLRYVSKKDGDSGKDASAVNIFQVIENKRPVLEFYKNNCIVYFIPAAFTALSILKKDAFQFSAVDLHTSYAFLQEFFKYEFAHDVDKTPEYLVRKNLKAFVDDAILMPHPTLVDTYNLTSVGYKKLIFFSAFLKTYFESYWIVLNFFMRYSEKYSKPKDRLKKINAIGNRMYKNKEIDRNEALSEITYKNAIAYFLYHKLTNPDNGREKMDFYTDAIRSNLNYL